MEGKVRARQIHLPGTVSHLPSDSRWLRAAHWFGDFGALFGSHPRSPELFSTGWLSKRQDISGCHATGSLFGEHLDRHGVVGFAHTHVRARAHTHPPPNTERGPP